MRMASPTRMPGCIHGIEESHIGGPMSLQSNIDLSDVDIYTAFKENHFEEQDEEEV